MTDDIKNIIESLLLVSESPLATDRIKQVIPSADTKEIKDALQMLSYEYEARKGGLFLCEVGGGYQLRTRPEYAEWVRCLIQPKPVRLSKPALETLAIIAYKQPVIRSDIEHIRGVDSGGVIRMLLERKFIRILGRKEIPGRPLIYATTKQFLEVFGLKDLRDLPTPKEIEAFGNSTSENDDVHKPSDGAENSVPEGKDFAGPKETETPLSESDKAEMSPDVKNEDIGSPKETEVSNEKAGMPALIPFNGVFQEDRQDLSEKSRGLTSSTLRNGLILLDFPLNGTSAEMPSDLENKDSAGPKGTEASENERAELPPDGTQASFSENEKAEQPSVPYGPKETDASETPLPENKNDSAELPPDGESRETEAPEETGPPFSENDRAEQVAPDGESRETEAPEETGPPFSENDRAEQVAPEETGPPFSENDKTEMPSELKSIAGQKETDASEKPPSENGNIQMLSEDSEKFDPDGEKNA